MMGNHVGDWEHVTVRLKNNRPWKMYVGAHNFGGVYTWNGHTFVKGESSRTNRLHKELSRNTCGDVFK